jgi:hypothetical protein
MRKTMERVAGANFGIVPSTSVDTNQILWNDGHQNWVGSNSTVRYVDAPSTATYTSAVKALANK